MTNPLVLLALGIIGSLFVCPSTYVLSKEIDELRKEVASLRAEVKALQERIAKQTGEYRGPLPALAEKDKKWILSTKKGTVWALSFSPDGSQLASGSQASAVHIWDVAAEAKIASFHAYGVRFVAYSGDGKLLRFVGFNAPRLWDVTARTEKGKLAVSACVYSGDGSMLAGQWLDYTSTLEPPIHVKLWRAETGEEIAKMTHSGKTWSGDPSLCVKFSPDGKTLVTGNIAYIKMWDVPNGKLKAQLKAAGVYPHPHSIAFSPDSSTLATVAGGQRIDLWDVKTGTKKATLMGHASRVNCLEFSPDGKTLASGSGTFHSPGEQEPSGEVKLWDVSSGAEKTILKGHEWPVYSLAFSPNGMLLASGSMDATIRLWDLRAKSK